MLPSHKSVAPIFFTGFFWIMLAINTILTVGINMGIDYGMNKNKSPPVQVIAAGSIVEVIIFTEIVSLCVFFGSGEIHKRIRNRQLRPVTRGALCDSLFKRIVLFSISEPNWKSRLPKFMVQVLFVPGLFVTVLCWMFCWMANDFKSGPCSGTVWDLVGWNMAWKGVTVIMLFTMNFAAAHNDETPELHDESAGLIAATPGVVVDYGDGSQPVKTASAV